MVLAISGSGSHSFPKSILFYHVELSMQIYARQDAKQCFEPEVPLLLSPFFETALNHSL